MGKWSVIISVLLCSLQIVTPSCVPLLRGVLQVISQGPTLLSAHTSPQGRYNRCRVGNATNARSFSGTDFLRRKKGEEEKGNCLWDILRRFQETGTCTHLWLLPSQPQRDST